MCPKRFFKTLTREEASLHDCRTFEEAEANLSRFIEDVYSGKRLDSSLGYRPPVEFEVLRAMGRNAGDRERPH